MLSYPRANQYLHSFKSIQVLSGPFQYTGLVGVSLKVEIEGRDPVYSTGTTPIGRPRGQQKSEFNMTFFADAFLAFARANPLFMDQEHDLTFVVQEGASRHTVDIRQLAFGSFEMNFEGNDATEVEVPGVPLAVFLDGVPIMQGDALSGVAAGFASF